MEIQTHPYEILVRFNCEPGEVAGAIRGMHLISGAYAVDDGGKIIGAINRGAEDMAAPLAQSAIAPLIGSAALATEMAHAATVAALQAQVQALTADIAMLQSERDHLRAVLAEAQEAA